MGASQGKLEQKYVVSKVELGHGSFGTVRRGTDKRTKAPVAIKMMSRQDLKTKDVNEAQIAQEISVMRLLSQQEPSLQHIVLLKDAFHGQKRISLVLEYCEGGDLGDKIKERSASREGIRESEAAGWMQQILSALSVLHERNICHRDVKPSSFLFGGGGILKLGDFGLALLVKPGVMLQEKCGTPAFMAPEMLHITVGYSFPVDMWSAGVIMYMLMCNGRHPFTSNGSLQEDRAINGQIDFFPDLWNDFVVTRFSHESREACRRMLEPDPTKRISGCGALKLDWLKRDSTGALVAASAPQSLKEAIADLVEDKIIAWGTDCILSDLFSWLDFVMGNPHPSLDALGADPAMHVQESSNILPSTDGFSCTSPFTQLGKKCSKKIAPATLQPLVQSGAPKKSKTSKRQPRASQGHKDQPKQPKMRETFENHVLVACADVCPSAQPATEIRKGTARSESMPALPNLLVQPAVVRRRSELVDVLGRARQPVATVGASTGMILEPEILVTL